MPIAHTVATCWLRWAGKIVGCATLCEEVVLPLRIPYGIRKLKFLPTPKNIQCTPKFLSTSVNTQGSLPILSLPSALQPHTRTSPAPSSELQTSIIAAAQKLLSTTRTHHSQEPTPHTGAMPSSDYAAATGGALKLKGSAGIDKKRKKKKSKTTDTSGAEASTPASKDLQKSLEEEDAREASEEASEKKERGERDTSRALSEEVARELVGVRGKTEAERKWEERRRKRVSTPGLLLGLRLCALLSCGCGAAKWKGNG